MHSGHYIEKGKPVNVCQMIMNYKRGKRYVFIFLTKQRTDWISLDWDNDAECKGKTGEHGKTTWTNKRTEHLNDMHKNSSQIKSTQKFWRDISWCLCSANKRM